METCLTASLGEFDHYIHQAIPAYTEKEVTGTQKSEIETLKEENNKLRQEMCEKEILKKRLTETLNEEEAKQKRETETRQRRKHQSRQNIPLDTINRFAPLQNI